MNVKAKVARLEKALGLGERCLKCRVHYIRFGDEIKRTAIDDLYVNTCGACGNKLAEIHAGFTAREREVLLLVAANEMGDPVKWLAAYCWMQHHPRFQEIESIGESEEKRLREQLNSGDLNRRASARKQVKFLEEQRAVTEAMLVEHEKSNSVDKSAREEAWMLPLLVMDRIRNRRESLKDHKLFGYFVMATMERRFIWGRVSSETRSLFSARKVELAEVESGRLVKEEEVKAQRTARDAERERQRLDRLGVVGQSAQTVPGQSPSSVAIGEALPSALRGKNTLARGASRPVLGWDEAVHPSMQIVT